METVKAIFPQSNDDHTNNDRKRANVETITCPHCSKSVKLVRYGNGWVGTCCDRVVYNSQTLPPYH
ncbi:MAG: hypothetical protein NTX36_12735 [Proteobacteria bacterium]|nr:hypothetical protein [Pseudomonadota bacterium]